MQLAWDLRGCLIARLNTCLEAVWTLNLCAIAFNAVNVVQAIIGHICTVINIRNIGIVAEAAEQI